jgi:uncharacterized protein
MLWSGFNVLFEYNEKHFLYNGWSNNFIELDEAIFFKLKSLEKGDEVELTDEEKEILEESKCLVKSDDNEFNKLKLLTNLKRYNSTTQNLTIAPTLACNFNCPYCYEVDRPNIYMSKDVEEKVIQFISNYKSVKELNINWYGGEPLMALDIIERITKKIKENKSLKYNSSIITNGYLLDIPTIKKLKDLSIRRVQITIDGDKETHDKRRILLNGEGTFDTIINNIDNLFKYYKEVKVDIRVNVDKSNSEEFANVFKFLKKRYIDNNISIYYAFVEDKACNTVPDCNLDFTDKMNFISDMFEKHGVDVGLFPENKLSECMARYINSYLIDPKGNLYKCLYDIGNEKMSVGNITTDKIITNNDLLSMYMVGADPFEDDKCKSCIHLMSCKGGCPRDRIFNEYFDGNFNTCDPRKGDLKKFLYLCSQTLCDE